MSSALQRPVSMSAGNVSIGLNKTLIVELPQDAHDIVVSDPGVCDAIVRATRTIFLFGKKVGQTNIFILDVKQICV
uniref:pilus assembly protein N-terminal domain-containing protein n=1 Tax=Rhizobium ruizarguesonis TaxID=2081791 RepID=UPI0037C95821